MALSWNWGKSVQRSSVEGKSEKASASCIPPNLNDESGALFDIAHLKRASNRDENIGAIRKRSRATYLGNDKVLCRTLGRYKFYVAASDVGFGAHIILDGYWEFSITEFIARCLKSNMTALDLGANFGYFTLLMADLVGPSGNVIAFEPNPTVSELLRHSVSINGFESRVTIDTRAVWSESGQSLNFSIPPGEPKNAHVFGGTSHESASPSCQVTTVALDDVVANRVDFLKVDVEGSEEHVWYGMQKFLKNNPEIIILLEFSCARCVDPTAILESIRKTFPLRYLDQNSAAVPIAIEKLLQHSGDWILILTNQQLPDPG